MFRLLISLFALALGLVLVIPLFVLFVPIWIFCLAVNVISSVVRQRGSSWSEILTFEPEIGWRPRPNLNTVYVDRVGDSCTIQTDSEGWPGSCTVEESDVVAIGDSFAFGYGSGTKSAYYSRTTDCRIKPIGAPGYNMVQELLLMKRLEDRLKGKVVVWFACIENDLAENLKAYNPRLYTNPFLRRNEEGTDWEIITDHVRPGGWLYGDGGTSNRTLFAHICTQSDYSERVFSAVDYLIREGKKICDRAGAELIVFSIPYKDQLTKEGIARLRKLANDEGFDPAYPDRKIAEICEKRAVPFIRGASHLTLRDYKIRDGHWSRRGNRKVGQLIEQYVRTDLPRQRAREKMPAHVSPLPRPA